MTSTRTTQPLSHRQVLLRAILGAVVLVLLLFVVATASALLIRSIVHPLVTLHRVGTEKRMWERKVTQKRRQLAAMEAKKQWWSSPNGKDELAHQMGLVRDGEQTVVVTPPTPPTPKAPVPVRHAGSLEISPTVRLSMLTLIICALAYGVLLLRRRRLLKTRREEIGVLTPRKELMRRRPVE